jgi:hypothetical protein
LDLKSTPEVVTAGLRLVLAAEAGPMQCVLDDFRHLANDIEQACDLGDGERDHSPTSSTHRRRIGYC